MSYQIPSVAATVQTTNTTPTVLASIPLSTNQAVYVSLDSVALKNNFTDASGGRVAGLFTRAAGNITRTGNPLQYLLQTVPLATATVTIVANTGAQTADVTVTGVAGTTISWNAIVTYVYTNK